MTKKKHSPLIELPTRQLLDQLGAGRHKPGSGSAAALLGLVSCKLIQTVVKLSDGRDQYQGVSDQLALANDNVADAIEPLLFVAIEEDSTQFHKVFLARRARDSVEKDSAEYRKLAAQALAELRSATEIPIRIAISCIELAENALTVFDLGYAAARGDSGVAVSAALAGASGAISIVYLNLTSFKGSEWAVEMRERADSLNGRVQRLQLELFARIERLQQEVVAKEPQKSE